VGAGLMCHGIAESLLTREFELVVMPLRNRVLIEILIGYVHD
jgi:hypothetical protein